MDLGIRNVPSSASEALSRPQDSEQEPSRISRHELEETGQKMSFRRTDSGYEEMSTTDSATEESLPALHDSVSAMFSTTQASQDEEQPLTTNAAIPPPQSSTTPPAHPPSSTSPSVKTSSRSHNSSRRSSTTRRSKPTRESSRQTSRRSSLKSRDLSSPIYRTRPNIPSRTSSMTVYDRSKMENPYLSHQRARQIFQSLGGAIAGQHPTGFCDPQRALARGYDAVPLSPSKMRPIVRSVPPVSDEAYEEKPSVSIPPARTIIDWTSPSTRRREYEKIDRSTKGLRGLWRRISPQWLRGSCPMHFYEGDDDAGSVRRYRLELPDVKDEKDGTIVGIEEKGEVRQRLGRMRAWSCFRAGDG